MAETYRIFGTGMSPYPVKLRYFRFPEPSAYPGDASCGPTRPRDPIPEAAGCPHRIARLDKILG
jgi:hypothetical protein